MTLARSTAPVEIPPSLPTLTPDVDLLVGETPAMRQVAAHVMAVARADRTSALILGETGTGKDLAAQAVHRLSRRASHPFIPLNCGAISPALAESELFGSDRGAFTDARSRRGAVEQAQAGTLFLDEIGELPLPPQRMLLRFLETRHYRRLGGERAHQADVRVIAATSRDLSEAVKSGAFRSDLFFRLNVFVITLPPLRERRVDLPALIAAFLRERSRATRLGFAPTGDAEATALLAAYDWPGNMRELRNVIERALILSQGGTITPDHLPRQVREPRPPATPAGPSLAEAIAALRLPAEGASLPDLVRLLEGTLIAQAMRRAAGNQSRAAAITSLTRDQLRQRLKR